jgi:16S rRNA (cytosine1402-N4)-methyltransferase
MAREIRDLFFDQQLELLVDCTLGMGGHVRSILDDDRAGDIRVIGCDCDAESLEIARTNLKGYGDVIDYYRCNYTALFDKAGLYERSRGMVLVDQGLSRFQIKDLQRGFSHSVDADLDMRRDLSQTLTAMEVINRGSFTELKNIFTRYGEIPNPDRLVHRIIEERLKGDITRTSHLTSLITEVTRWRPRRGSLHPAAQVYQALRIRVNRELDDLETFLTRIVRLNPGMVIIILTYHSLEDRMVKQRFTEYQQEGVLRIIPPFPGLPRDDEVAENLPSRSARLRAGRMG